MYGRWKEGGKEEKRKDGREGKKEDGVSTWKKVLTKTNFVPIGKYLLKTVRNLSQENHLRNKFLVYKKPCFFIIQNTSKQNVMKIRGEPLKALKLTT